MSIRLSVRIAVGVSGHRSGTARLWFNDAAANSRFDATINGVTSDRKGGGKPGEQERALVERVIEEAGGNLTLAASRLGLHRITLHKLLKRTDKAPAKFE